GPALAHGQPGSCGRSLHRCRPRAPHRRRRDAQQTAAALGAPRSPGSHGDWARLFGVFIVWGLTSPGRVSWALMYRLDLSVEGSPGGADLPRRGSGLLIRGFGVQVPGGAPGLTWGFTTPGHFLCVRFVLMFAPCLLGRTDPAIRGLSKTAPPGA